MPDSIFNVTGTADGGIFSPTQGYGADIIVSFVRSTLNVNTNLGQSRLNSAGETELSFATIGNFLVSLQPRSGDYVRLIHGIVNQIDFSAFYLGNANIQEGDRAMIEGRRVEVIAALHYGDETTEISLKYVGR